MGYAVEAGGHTQFLDFYQMERFWISNAFSNTLPKFGLIFGRGDESFFAEYGQNGALDRFVKVPFVHHGGDWQIDSDLIFGAATDYVWSFDLTKGVETRLGPLKGLGFVWAGSSEAICWDESEEEVQLLSSETEVGREACVGRCLVADPERKEYLSTGLGEIFLWELGGNLLATYNCESFGVTSARFFGDYFGIAESRGRLRVFSRSEDQLLCAISPPAGHHFVDFCLYLSNEGSLLGGVAVAYELEKLETSKIVRFDLFEETIEVADLPFASIVSGFAGNGRFLIAGGYIIDLWGAIPEFSKLIEPEKLP